MYPGFAASEVFLQLLGGYFSTFVLFTGVYCGQILYDANDKVIGIGTNDMGIAKDGSKKENFQCGVEVKGFILHVSFSHARLYVICLSSWSKKVAQSNACPATLEMCHYMPELV